MLTGPTKQETRTIIVDLEKYSKKSGKKIWKTIAKTLGKSTRNRARVNVYHLNRLSKKQKDKTFIVPGKVLATGDVDGKIEVACLGYSGKAKEKIEKQKGRILTLKELIEEKPKAEKMVIVK